MQYLKDVLEPLRGHAIATVSRAELVERAREIPLAHLPRPDFFIVPPWPYPIRELPPLLYPIRALPPFEKPGFGFPLGAFSKP
jgi:hypothetical protein